MPRAEAGTPKALSAQMKRKGLGRLRWYCQVCEKQCPDENGFKQHTMSESHVRQMQLVGANSGKVIAEYSRQFQRDFLQLLRTSHGEKAVNLNRFYNTYIADKHHVHQNATRWHSLTEFAKEMGRQGILRVQEEDPEAVARGGANAFTVAWVDTSPEALRRQDALKKRERLERGDEEREQALIRRQIERARRDKGLDVDGSEGEGPDEEARGLQRTDGEKITLSFAPKKKKEDGGGGAAAAAATTDPVSTPNYHDPTKAEAGLDEKDTSPLTATASSSTATPGLAPSTTATAGATDSHRPPSPQQQQRQQQQQQPPLPPPPPPSVAQTKPQPKPQNVFSSNPKPKPNPGTNPLAGKKANPLAGGGTGKRIDIKKPISEAERIMKEEMERKRIREEREPQNRRDGGPGHSGRGKRVRLG